MKYYKRRSTVEAIQWDGSNVIEMRQWAASLTGIPIEIGSYNGKLELTTHQGVIKCQSGAYLVWNGNFFWLWEEPDFKTEFVKEKA